jgi:RHS repeat-associated protein
MKPVSGSSGVDAVGATDELKLHAQTVNIAKNGYLYVYVSNQSDQDVFFDNLQVVHARGPLLEETHYYPFGLTMAGISSKAAGKLENRFKYNGNKLESGEWSDGSGLEMYDFNARTYDQQIGRFMQIDPELEDGQEGLTPYHFGLNNPILHNDPDGKQPGPVIPIIRGLYLLAKWSQEQGTPVASMTPTVIRDGTSVVKTVMDLKTLKEIRTVNVESKPDTKSDNPKGGTYILKDEDGKIQRTGRTNDLKRREGEHARNEKTKSLEFQVDRKTDNKDAQRGREQQIHEEHDPPLNKIKPISDKNPNKQKYLDAARELNKSKHNNQ